jgi:hypothetical protein
MRSCCFFCTVSCDHYDSAVALSHLTGNNIILPCAIGDNDDVSWLYIDFDTGQQLNIYGGGRVKKSYKERIIPATDCATGNCSLKLLNAQTNDSGWYVCVNERNEVITSKHVVTLIMTSEYKFHSFGDLIFI